MLVQGARGGVNFKLKSTLHGICNGHDDDVAAFQLRGLIIQQGFSCALTCEIFWYFEFLGQFRTVLGQTPVKQVAVLTYGNVIIYVIIYVLYT